MESEQLRAQIKALNGTLSDAQTAADSTCVRVYTRSHVCVVICCLLAAQHERDALRTDLVAAQATIASLVRVRVRSLCAYDITHTLALARTVSRHTSRHGVHHVA
jgi:hypothetical protein